MKKSSKIFVFVVLFFLYLPMTYFLGIKDQTKIIGVEPTTALPSIQEKSFSEKVFQSEFEKWWNSHFGFRRMLLKLKNSIYDVANLFVIHSGYSNTLIQTKNGNLIGRGYIDLVLNTPCKQNTPVLQKKLFMLVRNLEADDKKVLFVFGSSKAHLYQDELPKRFTFFKNSKCDIFAYWEDLLSSLDIAYYNTQPLVNDMKSKEGWNAYSRTGTHWNVYSSIRVTQEIGKKVGLADIRIDDVKLSSENLRGERDFANLLNVYWDYLPEEKFPKVSAQAMYKNKETIALIGDSYCGSVLDSLVRTKASDREDILFVSNRLMSEDEAKEILAKADIFFFITQPSELNNPDATMLKNIDMLLSVLPQYYAKGWLRTEQGTLLSTDKSYISVPQSNESVELSFDVVKMPKKYLILVNGRQADYHIENGKIFIHLVQSDFIKGKAKISFENRRGKIAEIEIKNIKVETAKTVAISKKLNFSDKVLSFKSSGLSFAENWGRWSDGDVVTMSFYLPEKKDYLFSFDDTHALTPPNNSQIDVDVYCKKQKISEWRFVRGKKVNTSFLIPKNCLDKKNKLNLVFKIKGAARPVDLGINRDTRKLAVGFHSLKIEGEK